MVPLLRQKQQQQLPFFFFFFFFSTSTSPSVRAKTKTKTTKTTTAWRGKRIAAAAVIMAMAVQHRWRLLSRVRAFGSGGTTTTTSSSRRRRGRIFRGSSSSSSSSSSPNDGLLDRLRDGDDDGDGCDGGGGGGSSSSYSSDVPDLVLPSHPGFPIRSVMAPMVAASDLPFRTFLRETCGVDLTFTQMLLSKRFNSDATFRRAHLDLDECNDDDLDDDLNEGFDSNDLLPSQIECLGDPSDLPPPRRRRSMDRERREKRRPRPVIVQLAGDDPDGIVETASRIYEITNGNLHGIDLNCGCPQGIARKGNYGAFLMDRHPERVGTILESLRKSLPPEVTVSAKIRLPPEHDDDDDDGGSNLLVTERIPMLLNSGIDFLTIHGRTRVENKQKVGAVHVDRMKVAIDAIRDLDRNFPVIANGGMENHDDVVRILRETGASAAMSSEALLETPDLFLPSSSSDASMSPEGRFRKQVGFARDYLDVCGRIGPPLPGVLGFNSGGSFNVVRGHLFKFLHRYLNRDHPDLRGDLAAPNVMRNLSDAHRLLDELEHRYLNNDRDDEGWWEGLESSSPESSWYRRHRKARSRVHVRHDLTTASGRERSSSSNAKAAIADKAAVRERLAAARARKRAREEEAAASKAASSSSSNGDTTATAKQFV